MTLRRSESTWVSVALPRRLTAAYMTAALVGVFAALGVLTSVGALLTSGGIDIFETGNVERFAASTVATAIGLVFAAFFCGGWAYGALRGRENRDREVHYSEPRSHQLRRTELSGNLTYGDLDGPEPRIDEFVGRMR